MANHETAITVLSTLGAVFWSTQLIPQIWLNYRRNHTDGLQPSMMLLWAGAGVPLGVHNILSNQPIALQVQAQILTGLSLVTWGQVMFYGHKWPITKCLTWVVGLSIGAGLMEAAVVLPFKLMGIAESHRTKTVHAMAVLSALGLALGVLRHYYDIYKHRTVRGISWAFVGLDAAGDLTSLLAIVLASTLDIWATVIYGSELALWIGMMVLGVVFNLRQYIIDSSPTRTQAEDVVDDAASQTSSASMSVFGTVAGVVRSSAVRQRLRLRHRDGTELSTLRREL